MKAKFKHPLLATCHPFGGAIFAGAALLLCTTAQGQNLFVGDLGSGNITNSRRMERGVPLLPGFLLAWPLTVQGNCLRQTTKLGIFMNSLQAERKALSSPCKTRLDWPLTVRAIYLSLMGPLVTIYEYTPGGLQTYFASGLDLAFGLAFQQRGRSICGEWQRRHGHRIDFRRVRKHVCLRFI